MDVTEDRLVELLHGNKVYRHYIILSTLKFRFKLSVNFADNVVYPRKGLRLNVF